MTIRLLRLSGYKNRKSYKTKIEKTLKDGEVGSKNGFFIGNKDPNLHLRKSVAEQLYKGTLC